MNDGGDCRTAPATPCLLKIVAESLILDVHTRNRQRVDDTKTKKVVINC